MPCRRSPGCRRCRPRLGTLVGTLQPTPVCACRAHVELPWARCPAQTDVIHRRSLCTPLADRAIGSVLRSARDVANGSVQAHFFPDDACDESAASGRVVEEGTNAGPDRATDAGVGGGGQGVGVGGPDIDGRDLAGGLTRRIRARTSCRHSRSSTLLLAGQWCSICRRIRRCRWVAIRDVTAFRKARDVDRMQRRPGRTFRQNPIRMPGGRRSQEKGELR